MTDELLSIGELARRTNRRASALRYYEEVGLLAEPVRVGGRRWYPREAVRTLAVVETAQRAGLSLGEIKALLAASADDASAAEELRSIAERRLPELEATIERAQVVRGWLQAASRCECPSLDDCCLFDDPSRLPAPERIPRSGPRSPTA
jgi:MerR family redox-sensitive transcriptional activator SoxR